MLVVLIEQCGGLAIASLRMNLYDAFAEKKWTRLEKGVPIEIQNSQREHYRLRQASRY